MPAEGSERNGLFIRAITRDWNIRPARSLGNERAFACALLFCLLADQLSKGGIAIASAVTITDVHYCYPDAIGPPVLSSFSLTVGDGSFVSVVGASGSGKSTLFKLIAGLLQPANGTIVLHDSAAARMSDSLRQRNATATGRPAPRGNTTSRADTRLGRVGYMPQQDLLLPWRTVMDNCLLPAELSRSGDIAQARRDIRELLSRFGLAAYESAYPDELSGGMRQRVALLRTIATRRGLLLLDEPFGALDALTKRGMHRWLLSHWASLQGTTILFITHDLEEALLLSDRIVVLGPGGSLLWDRTVELPRPRTADMLMKPEFLALRLELERTLEASYG